jgi:hypothetical protein
MNKSNPQKKYKYRKHTGGMIALSAALLFVIVGIAALVLYLTSGFGAHMELQNAVDAATLAIANQAAQAHVTLSEVDSEFGFPNSGGSGRVQPSCAYFLNGLAGGPNKDTITLSNLNDIIGSVLLISANIEHVHYCQTVLYLNALANIKKNPTLPTQIFFPEAKPDYNQDPTVQLFSDPAPHATSLHLSLNAATRALYEKLGLDNTPDLQKLFALVISQNPARFFGLLPAHSPAELATVVIEPVYYNVDKANQLSNILVQNDCVPDNCVMRGTLIFTQPADVTPWFPAPQLAPNFDWLFNPNYYTVPANRNLLDYGIYALPQATSSNPFLAHLIPVSDANQYLKANLPPNLKAAADAGQLLPTAVKATATFRVPGSGQLLTFQAAAEIPLKLPTQPKIAQIPNGYIQLANNTLSYTSVAAEYGLSPNLAQFGANSGGGGARIIRRGMQKWQPLLDLASGGNAQNLPAQDGQWPDEIYPGIFPFQLINQNLLVSIQNNQAFSQFLLPQAPVEPTCSTGNFSELLSQVCAEYTANNIPNYGAEQIRLIRYASQFAYATNWDEIGAAMASAAAPVGTNNVTTVACLKADPNNPGHLMIVNNDLPGTPLPPGEPSELRNQTPQRLFEYSPIWATPPPLQFPTYNPSTDPPFQPQANYLGRYNPFFLQLVYGNGVTPNNGDKIPNVIRGYDVNKVSTFPKLHDELSVTYFPSMNSGQLLQYMFGTEGFQSQ